MVQLYLLLNFISGSSNVFVLTYCIAVFGISYVPHCWPMPLRFKPKIDEKLQKLQSLYFEAKGFCNVDKKLISNGG